MRSFEYARPKTLQQALAALAEPGSLPLAGGTDLLSLMKDDLVRPSRLVDLKGLSELRGISLQEDRWRMGSLTTLDDLLENQEIRRRFPSLWSAAEGVRSPQIRSRGTVGGDLCQRPRCWYFRNGYGLLAMQGGKSMVLEGDNRYHAILGNSGPAYFVNPSSLAPALIALGAEVEIVSPKGTRRLELADFYRIPQGEGEKEYRLEEGEVLTFVSWPQQRIHNATYEVRQKEALDWPLASAAVAFSREGGRISRARVVLGQVAPIPWEAEGAAGYLQEKELTAEVAKQAGEEAVKGARALSRNAYKIRLAKVAVQRALLKAVAREV